MPPKRALPAFLGGSAAAEPAKKRKPASKPASRPKPESEERARPAEKRGKGREARSGYDDDGGFVVDEEEEEEEEESEDYSGSDDERPMCKWGAKCYRKNPHHLAQFRHPEKRGVNKKEKKRKTEGKERQRPSSSSSSSNQTLSLPALPNTFRHLEAFVDAPSLPPGVAATVRRFFVAFGGDLSERVGAGTTHVVTERAPGPALDAVVGGPANDHVAVVRSEWALRSIRERRLADEDAYGVE